MNHSRNHHDNRMLLIVDPQVDFISGTLPVPGARQAMDSLASYILAHGKEYAVAVVTGDRHPASHTSYISNGGQWEEHCRENTYGAEFDRSLMEALTSALPEVITLYKGEDPDKEEYSIFSNNDASSIITSLIANHDISTIDICGLAGDVCVLATIIDAVAALGHDRVRVLARFSPSLDNGKKLSNTLKELKIESL